MKKLIVITSPRFFQGEDTVLSHLFDEGMQRLHLRKPDSEANELRKLLDRIPAIYYPKWPGRSTPEQTQQPNAGRFYRHNQPLMPFDRRTQTVRGARLSVPKSYFSKYIQRRLWEWF